MVRKAEPKIRASKATISLGERFAREYVIDLNASEAVIRAGYQAKTRQAAANKACKLLALPAVAGLIADLKAKQFKRLEVKADNVLLELARLVDTDPAKLYDESGAMLPIHQMPEDIRRCISSIEYDQLTGRPKVKFWSKPEALALLGKHFKLFVDRVEVKEVGGFAERLARARARAQARASSAASAPASAPDQASPAPG